MVEDMSRYKSLCASVILRAILDLKRYKTPRGKISFENEDSEAALSAIHWMFGRDEFRLDFGDCCDAIGQDRKAIRKKAIEIITVEKGLDFKQMLGELK